VHPVDREVRDRALGVRNRRLALDGRGIRLRRVRVVERSCDLETAPTAVLAGDGRVGGGIGR